MNTVVEIDMLEDFANKPGAKLPVPRMLDLVGYISELENIHKTNIIVFRDSHSFDDEDSKKEFDIFGPHCIKDTYGASRVGGLKISIEPVMNIPKTTTNSWVAVRKMNHKRQTMFMDILKNSDHIAVTGVVTRICVKEFVDEFITNSDYIPLKDKIYVIKECVANLKGGLTSEECFDYWQRNGINVVSFDEYMKIIIKGD